jgi:hypothetical protein
MQVTGQICPVSDLDYYAITVPTGSNLVTVSAGYGTTMTAVQLVVQLLTPDGMTRIDDLADTVPDDHLSQLDTTFRVPAPGNYLLLLRDFNNANVDLRHDYSLTASVASDPDTHEPNDTIATAKPADAQPGWFSYHGDVDYFSVTTTSAQPLIQFKLNVPAGSPIAAVYRLLDGQGNPVASGTVPPGGPLDSLRRVPAVGTYYVELRGDPTKPPSYAAGAGYTIELRPLAESDPSEPPGRNDTAATASCLSGSGTCGSYTGTSLQFPAKVGRIAESADYDIYRFNVSASVTQAAVVQIAATMNVVTPLALAADLLVPDESTSCTQDTECFGLGLCQKDPDCEETSHYCISMPVASCPNGQPCKRCAGANLCIPGATGATRCGYWQDLEHIDSNAPLQNGVSRVATAQPLFKPGPYYVAVHSYQDVNYDYSHDYTLTVSVDPEPDAADASETPSDRDNIYSPYATPDYPLIVSRAKDISSQIASGTPVSGHISYQHDEDWYIFSAPPTCTQGSNCGFQFEYTQPGPANIRLGIYMYGSDGSGFGSWGYTGATDPLMLTSSVTDIQGDGTTADPTDCRECTLSRAPDWTSATPPQYYLRVVDLSQSGRWDVNPSHGYSFRLIQASVGCPATCRVYMGMCGKDPSPQCNPTLSFP